MAANAKKSEKEGPGFARLTPTQQRSRDRYEKILEDAARLLADKGGEAFRMSDLVERSGVPFGSLYQYFPDKTAVIGTLAERYNAAGRVCVAEALAPVKTAKDVHPALCRIVDEYYAMFVHEPVTRQIWAATQADPVLQKLDAEDMHFLSALLLKSLRRASPNADAKALAAYAHLTMQLSAAAVRHAILLDARQAALSLALFKRMLPKSVASVLA